MIKRLKLQERLILWSFFSTASFINIKHFTTTYPDSLQLFLDMHLTLPTAREIHRNPDGAKNVTLSLGQIYKYSIYVIEINVKNSMWLDSSFPLTAKAETSEYQQMQFACRVLATLAQHLSKKKSFPSAI